MFYESCFRCKVTHLFFVAHRMIKFCLLLSNTCINILHLRYFMLIQIFISTFITVTESLSVCLSFISRKPLMGLTCLSCVLLLGSSFLWTKFHQKFSCEGVFFVPNLMYRLCYRSGYLNAAPPRQQCRLRNFYIN